MEKHKKALTITFWSIAVALIFVLGFFLYSAYNAYIHPLKYENEIVFHAQENNLSPVLVASVICAESRFNPNAESKKGARGLMQLLPTTAAWISQKNGKSIEMENLFDPETNIEIGCSYLSYLFQKFQNLTFVLCAYNAGEGNVQSWLNKDETLSKIPFPETETYVKKVLNNMKYYENKF